MRRCWGGYLGGFVSGNDPAALDARSTQLSQVLNHLHLALFCLYLPLVAFFLLLFWMLFLKYRTSGLQIVKIDTQ